MKARIDSSEFHNDRYTTQVTTPAPDNYSQPSSFKLSSSKELGPVKGEITVMVSVRGFIKHKPYKDKNTGQNKVFHEANVFLDVVEK
jgi:hypothetical protein